MLQKPLQILLPRPRPLCYSPRRHRHCHHHPLRHQIREEVRIRWGQETGNGDRAMSVVNKSHWIVVGQNHQLTWKRRSRDRDREMR